MVTVIETYSMSAHSRPPNEQDIKDEETNKHYVVGHMWIDSRLGMAWMLNHVENSKACWVLFCIKPPAAKEEEPPRPRNTLRMRRMSFGKP